MNPSFKAWATWSLAVFTVWAFILLVRLRAKKGPALRDFAILFAGYFIGWLAATIKFVLITR